MTKALDDKPRVSKRASIYRNAARWMEQYPYDGRGMCNAIWMAQHKFKEKQGRTYSGPLHTNMDDLFEFDRFPLPALNSHQEIRVVALCFMAAMVEAGDA